MKSKLIIVLILLSLSKVTLAQLLFNRGDTIRIYQTIAWDIKKPSVILHANSQNGLYIGAKGTGANPIIYAMVPATNPVKIKTNVYRYKIRTEGKLSQVSIDGNFIPVARLPKTGWAKIDSVGSGFALYSPQMPYGNFTGGEAVIRKEQYFTDVNIIKTDVGNKITVGYTVENPPAMQSGYGFFFQNHMNCLKRSGDWFANDTALFVYFSDDPLKHKVEYSPVAYAGWILSSNNVTIEGIDFIGGNEGNLKIQNVEGLTVRNCNFKGSNTAVQSVNKTIRTTIENSKAVGLYRSAFDLAGECRASDIRKNIIESTGLYPGAYRTGKNGSAIDASSDSLTIEENTITNTGYNPISFFGDYCTVRKNVISRFCLTEHDGGGIYTFNHHGRILNRFVIEDNYVFYGLGAGAGTRDSLWLPSFGIYLDDKSNGGIVRNNVVGFNNGAGIYVHNSFNNLIENNSLIHNWRGSYWYNDDSGVQMINNTFLNNKILRLFSQVDIKIESITGRTNFFK